ncbi:MAG: CRISPR-associated helicase Cas3' [bacterium]
MNIRDFIKDADNFYAHKDGKVKEVETVEEHSNLALEYAKKIIFNKNLEPLIHNIGKSFLEEENSFLLWEEMFYNTIYLHDLGKVNINFQADKMKNKLFKNYQNRSSHHSFASAKLYFDIYFKKIKELENKDDKKSLRIFLCLNMFVISKHHGYIDCYSKFISDLEIASKDFLNNYEALYSAIQNIELIQKENILKNTREKTSDKRKELENKEEWGCIDLYIYTKLLFSLLVSSDFYSTSDYMSGSPVNDFGIIDDINEFYSNFKNTSTYNHIQDYSKNRKNKDFNNINEARSELFLETEENLLKNLDKNLFYLEAPTGSGKTNTAINLSLKLIEKDNNLNKIFYIFPFNTLVEQTRQTLEECFSGETYSKIGVINSLTPLYNETNEENEIRINNKTVDFKKILLDRQFIHYPIVLTTHVNLFNWLFGIGREDNFALAQLANSVIVLDEIQSYKNSIWKEIAIFLNKYAKILNIKILIMSATLPEIGDLTINSNDFIKLIQARNKYFQCEYFKNRVIPDFSLIDEFKNSDKNEFLKILCDKCVEEYKNNKKVLIEFIMKKTSLEFFKLLKEKYPETHVNLLNGDDNLIDRKNIINEIKQNDLPVILVATQIIEAGVDIDMDTGFKDISILDSEEQFMGRINRSCKKDNCKVYFFNYNNEKAIYKDDKRIEYNLLKEDIREILKNKNFNIYYSKVIESLESQSFENNNNNIAKFKEEEIVNLKFSKIQKKLRLIDPKEHEYTIFINREIKTDNGILSGEKVWEDYKNLLENKLLEYSEKRVKLSKIIADVNYFTYKVSKNNFTHNDNIGDIFYIENGEEYFIKFDGVLKFDREKFEGKESLFEFI